MLFLVPPFLVREEVGLGLGLAGGSPGSSAPVTSPYLSWLVTLLLLGEGPFSDTPAMWPLFLACTAQDSVQDVLGCQVLFRPCLSA